MTDSRHTVERRAVTEMRVAGRRLEGYAATFGTEAGIAGFTEVILPGAFSESLRSNQDILALVDHDPRLLLARTRSGSLRLEEDEKGLAFALDVPDTNAGRDALALAERGDLGGMSFGFRVRRDGERWQGKRRELRNVELLEISVVASWPAYRGTIVNARSLPHAERLKLARLFLETVT